MPDPLSHRPEARKEQTREMVREVAAHLHRLADRTDLDDADFDGCLGMELMLLTNARQHWKKAIEEQHHVLRRHRLHQHRYDPSGESDEPAAA